VLLGTAFREHIANIGNIMGTRWGTHWELEREHVGNKGKSSLFQPKLRRKKIKAL